MNLLTQAAGQDPNKMTAAPAPAPSVAAGFDVQGAAGAMKGPTDLKVEDNMLASKQLDSILSRDNPLMQKARARAQMAANRRGLLNSTMAAQAGESAVIDAAMPLAQQDANTNFQAGQFNAGARNDFSRDDNRFGRDVAMARFGALVGAEEKAADRQFQSSENLLERQFRTGEREGQQAWQAGENAADRSFRASERAADQGFRAEQAGLDRGQQIKLQEMGQKFQMDFEKFKLPMNMMASFTDKMQSYVTEVMRDPNMDQAAKDQAIANYYSYSQQQMGWMSTFFGQSMPNMQGGANIMPAGAAPAPANVGAPAVAVPSYQAPAVQTGNQAGASPTVSTPAYGLPVAPVNVNDGRLQMRAPISDRWGAFR